MACAVGITAGCGSAAAPSSPPQATGPIRTIHLVFPMTMAGGQNADMVTAARLALADAGGGAGGVRVRLVIDNNSNPRTGEVDKPRSIAAATASAADPQAIAVEGTQSSTGTVAMAPIINRAGIMHVINTLAVSNNLTEGFGENSLPSPKVAPTGRRTIVRIVPQDTGHALAMLQYMQSENYTHIVIVRDDGVFGTELGGLIRTFAPRFGITVMGTQVIPDQDTTPSGLATTYQTAKRIGTQIAISQRNAQYRWAIALPMNPQALQRTLINSVNAVTTNVGFFTTTAGSLENLFAQLSPGIQQHIYSTTFAVPASATGPDAVLVSQQLAKILGRPPRIYALWGYEGVAFVLDCIRRANTGGHFAQLSIARERAAILRAAFATQNRHSIVGAYSISPSGQTTSTLWSGSRVADGAQVRTQLINTELLK